MSRFITRGLGLVIMSSLLGGCNVVLLNPSGDVALQQRNLIIASTMLMLLIIVPVIVFTLVFARRYRASNEDAVYDPDFHHSARLELVIWAAPLTIVVALGALTWVSTHTLDPFRPLGRIASAKPISPGVKPITVQVVALDWKWLFFYPDQGIATVNEVAAPLDVPLEFKITSATVMNSFFVPALAGQIYAMAGMETKLHAVINHEGDYNGFSANYSGAGFSKMNFPFRGMTQANYDGWIAKVKAEGSRLDQNAFLQLEKPSEREPIHYYAAVEDGLYDKILNMCALPGKMCMSEMMHIDAMGGGGRESEATRERLEYDGRRMREGGEMPGATFPASGRLPNTINGQPQGMRPRPMSPDVNAPAEHPGHGQGQSMPGAPEKGPAPAQLNDHSGHH